MITLQILFPLAIIKYMKFFIKGQSKFGSSLSLPAYGREGQGQHIFSWRRISQSEIRNSAAAEKLESENELSVSLIIVLVNVLAI